MAENLNSSPKFGTLLAQPKHCCLPWCRNFANDDENDETIYFPFPIDRDRQIEWIHKLRMGKVLTSILPMALLKSYFLCQLHFQRKYILKNPSGLIITRSRRSFLNPAAIPTENLEGMFYTFYNQGQVFKKETLKVGSNPCCCIVNCNKKYCDSSDSEVALYRFPQDNELLDKWISAVRNINEIRSGVVYNKNDGSQEAWRKKYICSEHFSLDDLTPVTGEFFTLFSISEIAVPCAREDRLFFKSEPDEEPNTEELSNDMAVLGVGLEVDHSTSAVFESLNEIRGPSQNKCIEKVSNRSGSSTPETIIMQFSENESGVIDLSEEVTQKLEEELEDQQIEIIINPSPTVDPQKPFSSLTTEPSATMSSQTPKPVGTPTRIGLSQASTPVGTPTRAGLSLTPTPVNTPTRTVKQLTAIMVKPVSSTIPNEAVDSKTEEENVLQSQVELAAPVKSKESTYSPESSFENIQIATPDSVPQSGDWVKPASQTFQKCLLRGCGRKYDKNITEDLILFGFPSDKMLSQAWLAKICSSSQSSLILKNDQIQFCIKSKICSLHFDPSDIEKRLDESLGTFEFRLKPMAVPDRNLPTFRNKSEKNETKSPNLPRVKMPVVSSSEHVSLDLESPKFENTPDVKECLELPPPEEVENTPMKTKLLSESGKKFNDFSQNMNFDKHPCPPNCDDHPLVKTPKRGADCQSDSEGIPSKYRKVTVSEDIQSRTEVALNSSRIAENGMQLVPLAPEIPLATQCYIIEAIRQTQIELSRQFRLPRSQIIKVWEERKLLLTTQALGED